MMEKKKCSDLSNSEIKLYMETLSNMFENKKNELTKICEDMEEIENEYLSAKRELDIRKNILW
jgi:hypothetical protein